MYFQLLVGTHVEGVDTYKVLLETDSETGVRRVLYRPVVQSKKDLVSIFGPDKFRRVNQQEAEMMVSQYAKYQKEATTTFIRKSVDEEVMPDKQEERKKEVAKAVAKGATAIAEPPGVDVKHKFSELSDYPTIDVYFKRGKGYFVCENGEIRTAEPLKRDEVVGWVESFMEG